MRDLKSETINALGGNTFKLATGIRHAYQAGSFVVVTIPKWIETRSADLVDIEPTSHGSYNLTAIKASGQRATRIVSTVEAVSAADLPSVFRRLAGLPNPPQTATNPAPATAPNIPYLGLAI